MNYQEYIKIANKNRHLVGYYPENMACNIWQNGKCLCSVVECKISKKYVKNYKESFYELKNEKCGSGFYTGYIRFEIDKDLWESLQIDNSKWIEKEDGTRERLTIVEKAEIDDWFCRNEHLDYCFEDSISYKAKGVNNTIVLGIDFNHIWNEGQDELTMDEEYIKSRVNLMADVVNGNYKVEQCE